MSEKTNDFNISFEKMVKLKVSDPIAVDSIVSYFKNNVNTNDTICKIIFEGLSKYDDILNEFIKCLTNDSFNFPNQIMIEGYTAKQISELKSNFNDVIRVYTILQSLREAPEETKMALNFGFSKIDPIKLNISSKENIGKLELEKKYLNEISDEVDELMIKEGLYHKDENGNIIPSFGSCQRRWSIEKKILKERYNLDWQTPSEKNPFIDYD